MRSSKTSGAVLAASIAAVALSCSTGKKAAPKAAAAPATYYQDIKPLIDARCTGCHTSGGLAFSLTSYDDVMQKRSAVTDAVTSRRMPVWLAAPGHQAYRDDPSLSDAELQLFKNWAAAGYPAGDAARQPPPASALLQDLDGDLSLPVHANGAHYLPTQKRTDDYRCFLADWPFKDQVKYVTGMQAIPGNKAIVHHLVVYHVAAELAPMLHELEGEGGQPGYQCFGGATPDSLGDPAVQAKIEKEYPGLLAKQQGDITWVGHYAPGMRGHLLPEGTGEPLDPGGLIVVQVHYYTKNSPNTADDGGEVRFKLADQVKIPGFVIPFSKPDWLDSAHNRSLIVPPHAEATVSYDLPLSAIAAAGQEILKNTKPVARLTIHSANLHMHSYGKSAVTYLTDQSGAKDVLLEIPQWNLGFQRDYTLVSPKVFTGAELAQHSLHLECTYANNTDHEVLGGFSSDQEMCFNFAFVTAEFSP